MISAIFAVDANNLIGKGNGLPWHIPSDLAYFKAMTKGKTVIMGAGTYRSLPGPLPDRRNIVITNSDFEKKSGVEFRSMAEVEQIIQGSGEDIFIIGGRSIFASLIKYCDRIYMTKILSVFEGDVYLDTSFLKDFETHSFRREWDRQVKVWLVFNILEKRR